MMKGLLMAPSTWNDACYAAVLDVIDTPFPLPTFRSLYDAGDYESMARLAFHADMQTLSVLGIREVLVRKQRDYGHQNILRFGRDGVLVRLWDKVARLENLQKATEINFESEADTLLDIIGYVTILKMLENGTFTLEVE